jgi:hypothetical protein
MAESAGLAPRPFSVVEIEMRKSKPVTVANDWFDLDHLTHLPYVDLYIADAEIVNNTVRVLRRVDNLPPTVRSVHPVSIDGSLGALQEAIEARAGEKLQSRNGDDLRVSGADRLPTLSSLPRSITHRATAF